MDVPSDWTLSQNLAGNMTGLLKKQRSICMKIETLGVLQKDFKNISIPTSNNEDGKKKHGNKDSSSH
jgi:hypothetical protein